MKIAVFSDTHGYAAPMLHALAEHRVDAVIHCGDGVRDLAEIKGLYPEMPIYAVAGNCDLASGLPLTRTETFGGVRVLITHGHGYGVRSGGTDRLLYAAEEAGARLAVYGHTHAAHYDIAAGIALINPGSMGYPPYAWCILDISEDGEIRWTAMRE